TTTTTNSLDVSALVAQLRALEHLTRTEARIARVRTAQARTAAVRRELRTNAADADRRAARIGDALRSLDAVPDVLAPAVGGVVALVKAIVEQVQPVDEALLGDLVLEHQLLDRAQYARGLAVHLGLSEIVALTDTLGTAHGETVEWLRTVLEQEASGGPRALEPTQLQRIAGGATRLAGLPARFAVERVNRTVDAMIHRGQATRARVEGTVEDTADATRNLAADAADTVTRIGRDTREVVDAGRDAALTRTEQVARAEDADTVADVAHEARAEVGALSADELPIPDYDELTAQPSIAAIRDLDDPGEIRAVAAFEAQHKNRVSVLDAADSRIAALDEQD
ncbi:MAG: hypothetical protein L0H84_24050, partial [Pseudonocardia sp.]|nr:hypothetical protein [Pseudonocardia sp.]